LCQMKSAMHTVEVIHVCRFCLDDTGQQTLVSPCACSGSQKFVHLPCLRKWQAAVPDEPRASICNVCKETFSYHPPTQSWLSKFAKTFWEVFPAFIALIGVLSLNHSMLFFACVSLLTIVCMKTFAAAVLLLVGIFALLICLQIRRSRPIMFIDESGRTRVALIRHGERVDGLAPGMFLVASDIISSGVFRHSVVLLLEHGEEGSRGVIANAHLSSLPDGAHSFLAKFRSAYGGPVHDRVLVHPFDNVGSSASIQLHTSTQHVYLGGDLLQIARRMENLEVPFPPTVFEGTAVWTAGQLDGEVRQGLWGWLPASHETLQRAFTEHAGTGGVGSSGVWRALVGSQNLRRFRNGTPAGPVIFPNM
jgi:putative AlgH/UPF0301 family transcriptional regulator